MSFDDSFLNNLSDDPEEALRLILSAFNSYRMRRPASSSNAESHEGYVKAYYILRAFCEAHGFEVEPIEFSGETNVKEMSLVANAFDKVASGLLASQRKKRIAGYREKYQAQLIPGFGYTFSDGDLKRIQELINELRDLIASAEYFDDKHRARILKRLEKLQSELHKTVGDLDRFWGVIIDLSIVAKQVGDNARPLVKRMEEIMRIVWQVQARAEELPSSSTLQLPGSIHSEDEEEEK